jgi:hypothetical protein
VWEFPLRIGHFEEMAVFAACVVVFCSNIRI